jgi:LysM repeat protein
MYKIEKTLFMKFISILFLASFFTLFTYGQVETIDTIDNQQAVTDSIDSPEYQEDAFQNFLDTIYYENELDTFAWDNKMINSGRFDSKNMTDIVKIPLNDTLKKSYFAYPFKNYVTSGFGPRRWLFHYGVDIKVLKGDTILSVLDGVVRVVKYDRRGFGKVVVIRHSNGLETIYGHLSKELVLPNQKVKAGESIGLGGNTGRSTGSHLHFETRYHGEPFDPNYFIDFSNYILKCDTLVISKANFDYLVELRKAKYHTIRKGDYLGKIARKYHTSVRKLCSLNHISTRTLLRPGRKIRYQ